MHQLILLLASGVAGAAPVVPAVRTPVDVVRAFLALKNPSAAQLRELVADDVVFEATGQDADRVGLDALAETLHKSAEMLPDARYDVVSVATDGARVFAETRTTGTVRAVPAGTPSSAVGRYVNLRTVNVFEVKDGRIKKLSAFFDILNFWRQLGIPR